MEAGAATGVEVIVAAREVSGAVCVGVVEDGDSSANAAAAFRDMVVAKNIATNAARGFIALLPPLPCGGGTVRSRTNLGLGGGGGGMVTDFIYMMQ